VRFTHDVCMSVCIGGRWFNHASSVATIELLGGRGDNVANSIQDFSANCKKLFGRWQKFAADTIAPKTVYKEVSFITFHFE
jgi:hypothetical protein